MATDWQAQQYAENARFVSDLGRGVIDWLDPKPGERILDLGCGDGVLTKEIADRGCEVVGVDASPDMVRAAKELGVDARVASGEDLPFEKEFDAVFSNAALHWMLKPDAVIASVARALKSGGRFVGEFGGHGNVAAIATALRASLEIHGRACPGFMPWFYPTTDEYSAKLESAGFKVERIILFPRPTPLPTGMESWLRMFAGPFFSQCEEADVPKVVQTAVDLLEPSLKDTRGHWTADYVRLRFDARIR